METFPLQLHLQAALWKETVVKYYKYLFRNTSYFWIVLNITLQDSKQYMG